MCPWVHRRWFKQSRFSPSGRSLPWRMQQPLRFLLMVYIDSIYFWNPFSKGCSMSPKATKHHMAQPNLSDQGDDLGATQKARCLARTWPHRGKRWDSAWREQTFMESENTGGGDFRGDCRPQARGSAGAMCSRRFQRLQSDSRLEAVWLDTSPASRLGSWEALGKLFVPKSQFPHLK